MQRRWPTPTYRFAAGQTDIADLYPTRWRCGFNLARVENGQALQTTKANPAIGQLHPRADEIARSLSAFAGTEILDATRLGIVATHSGGGRKPEPAITVFEDATDGIGRQTIGAIETLKSNDTVVGVAIGPIETTALGSDPESALTIFQKAGHCRMTQSRRIGGICGVAVERLVSRVEQRHAAEASANPDTAESTLAERLHSIARQAGRIFRVVPKALKLGATETQSGQATANRRRPNGLRVVDHQFIKLTTGCVPAAVITLAQPLHLAADRIHPRDAQGSHRHP